MSFRGYLFDLDGTLVDSVQLILDSFHHTRRVHFRDVLSDEAYLETLGMPLRDVFRPMATDHVSVDALIRTYVEFNAEHHDRAVSAYPGIGEVIQTLRARGARLAVVTSKINAHARRGLEITGLSAAFELLVGADDVVRAKPDPEPVRLALARLGLRAEEAVFVGDSPHDIQAGNRAGVATAAASWGPFPESSLRAAEPTYWLANPADVLAAHL